jgi:hypothetical protein
MTKNKIQKVPDEEFVATNRDVLSELAESPTKEDVARGYQRLFESMWRYLNKYELRLDVGWDPPDHMLFIHAEPQETVALFRSTEGSPEQVELSEVVNSLFTPKDILHALNSQLSNIRKCNQQKLQDLELVTSCVSNAVL